VLAQRERRFPLRPSAKYLQEKDCPAPSNALPVEAFAAQAAVGRQEHLEAAEVAGSHSVAQEEPHTGTPERLLKLTGIVALSAWQLLSFSLDLQDGKRAVYSA
jgi:hypothetical protein